MEQHSALRKDNQSRPGKVMLRRSQWISCGHHDLAVTLAPVTIDQFIAVCRQNRIMPPKSTWFQPKIRSGLVMALLG